MTPLSPACDWYDQPLGFWRDVTEVDLSESGRAVLAGVQRSRPNVEAASTPNSFHRGCKLSKVPSVCPRIGPVDVVSIGRTTLRDNRFRMSRPHRARSRMTHLLLTHRQRYPKLRGHNGSGTRRPFQSLRNLLYARFGFRHGFHLSHITFCPRTTDHYLSS
jgi:hypothetical protein